MIQILPIASGSSGNCVYADIDGHRIIVDLGVTARTLVSSLLSHDIAPTDVEAVFITHSHSDHIKGLKPCMNKIRSNLYMSDGTYNTLFTEGASVLPYSRTTEITPGLRVTSFRTSHDCMGSVGYLFETEHSRLGYATDLGVMTGEIRELLSGADVLIIESNHDEEMLRTGPYPYYLKRRILSESGHLSNAACAEAIEYFISRGTRNFLLAHLSRENNRPELALFSAMSVVNDPSIRIDVLPATCGTMHHY